MTTISVIGFNTAVINGAMEPLPEGYAIVIDNERRLVTDVNGKILIARYE